MWRVVSSVMLLAACHPPAQPAPAAASPSEAVQPPEDAAEAEPPTTRPAPPTSEAPPDPALVFVGDGWVRDPEDPSTPLLRFTTLEPTSTADPAPVHALLAVLPAVMDCYDAALSSAPELHATIRLMRRTGTPPIEDPEIQVQPSQTTTLTECVSPLLRTAVSVIPDPHGRYALSLFPQRNQAPRLREPFITDEVVEREGGACFTRRVYPCKPNKRCKAPDWERTQCLHPADRPGVALRWAFGAASEHRWPILGLDLVALDDSLIWRIHLQPEDAERLGTMHEDEAAAHLRELRDRELPGTWLATLEPTRIMLADRAGVRVLDRHTGQPRFRYAVPNPDAPRMWFDDGTFTAKAGRQRCTGDAHGGTFAVRCGEDLLYFDGYALAVIASDDAVWLRGTTTLDDPGSTRTGGAAHPRAALRAAGYRVSIEGMVYMQ